jgi:hypothetical protein
MSGSYSPAGPDFLQPLRESTFDWSSADYGHMASPLQLSKVIRRTILPGPPGSPYDEEVCRTAVVAFLEMRRLILSFKPISLENRGALIDRLVGVLRRGVDAPSHAERIGLIDALKSTDDETSLSNPDLLQILEGSCEGLLSEVKSLLH